MRVTVELLDADEFRWFTVFQIKKEFAEVFNWKMSSFDILNAEYTNSVVVYVLITPPGYIDKLDLEGYQDFQDQIQDVAHNLNVKYC